MMKLEHQHLCSPARDKRPVLKDRIFLKRSLICIKLVLVITLSACLSASASGYAQSITLFAKNALLKNVFNEIQKQTGYEFIYTTEMLKKASTVTIDVKNADISEVLSICFKDQPFSYTLVGKTVALRPNSKHLNADAGKLFAPPVDIRGRVVNDKGEVVAGASVQIKGTPGSTVSTDKDGMFSIKAEEGAELIITYVSFQSKTVKVTKSEFLNISLVAEINQLDQLTVTGYTEYARSKSPSATGTVSSKDINDVPMSTLDQILQGRVPGLNVTSGSGQPGESASVVIRGIGSINGSTTPLYVMDGVPIEATYFQTINPQDVESVTVLKDASAKALYGSRGSNGVIVITTKKGKQGTLRVGYSSQYGFSNLTSPRFEMMNAEERLKFEEEVGSEIGKNIGPGWTYSKINPYYATQSASWQQRADAILDSLKNINTDWRDMFFQHGSFTEQQVNLSGGNEHIKVYTGLGYWKQNGIVKETGLDRYSLRSNVDMNYGKFTAGVNLTMGYSNSRFSYNDGGTGVGSPMASVYYALPYEYPYTPDGAFHPADDASFTSLDTREGSRGIDALYGVSDKTQQFKTILGLNMAYEIVKGLKLSTRAGVDYRNSTDQTFYNPLSYIGKSRPGNKGSFGEGTRRNYNLVSTSGITYKKRWNLHDFEVSGFFEYLYNGFRSFSYTGYGLDDRLPESPGAITVSTGFLPSVGGSRSTSAMTSYMGVGRYTYNDKYTLTASYRYDGASLSSVPAKNRWQGFYSFGASWDVKKESFLQDISLISNLRMRASFGQTASPFGSSYSYLPVYEVNTTYGGQPAIRPVNIGNPDFDWEYVDEFNAGFDLSLFKSQRLKLILDVYNRTTKNMFLKQPLSATAGANGELLPLSTGRMRNRGIEFNISGDVIQGKDFNWNIGVNASINQNRILRVSDLVDELPEDGTRIIKKGYAYGTYYAPQWAGVDKETGDALYYNRDGSVTTLYNQETQNVAQPGASLYPSFTGGITTTASWKNLSISALFSFVSNVQRWNNIDFYIETERFMTSNQSRRMLYERWKKPGDNALLQRIDVPRNFTSKDIQDASFMRLRNLKLNYSIPQALLTKTRVFKSVNIFIQGENLFTWTSWRGLDPENNRIYGRFEYPNARTYTAGINVNF